jgi:hypothetical protein
MDDLSLLEAGSIDDAVAAEPASSSLPAPDFTGSLDYIDALARRNSLTLSRRDAFAITTAVNGFDYLSPLLSSKAVPTPTDVGFNFSSDFRPLGDARRFDPEGFVRSPRALVRSSARVVSPSTPYRVPPGWRNPLDPTRSPGDIERAMRDIERRVFRKPWASRSFSVPDQVVICLKRKVRRNVMHAFGFAGGYGFRIPRRTYWSSVIC